MRVFLTGATGFVGAAILPELLKAGHQVLGLTRSDQGAAMLEAAGAKVHRGALEDPATLSSGAALADGVIHCAFDHDFSNFVANCEKDARVITAMGEALRGTDKPLVITSGVGLGAGPNGELATEDRFNPDYPNPRKLSEVTGNRLVDEGLNVSFVRLPQVHDTRKQGLLTYAITVAKQKGLSAYTGDGSNRFSAAHISDVARLYVLALERAEAGARYHAVDEEGISMRAIAETIGKAMGVPVRALAGQEAEQHFGWLAMFTELNLPASSALTRAKLDWSPTGPKLLEDLERMDYSAV